MLVYMRDGDTLEIEVNGKIVKINVDLPDLMPETVPQLEIVLPTVLTCNLNDSVIDTDQIIIPIP
jgi:hypothetical protein